MTDNPLFAIQLPYQVLTCSQPGDFGPRSLRFLQHDGRASSLFGGPLRSER
jgi:hypothetical protein